ncbi:prephenate dehydrogenase/arogenate dehydrogenase family protein [Eggerthellaceae bacterium zg-893]|nr:prephenate dehydrogenase/arogenate dehydrogenase family protein [Eggerthellaceae bacterium zg-893]
MADRNDNEPCFSRIAVIGFGLIGASFAAAVRQRWPQTELLAVDVDDATLQSALSHGWATAVARPESSEFKRYVQEGCDLVMIATPVGAAEGYLKSLAAWGYGGIVTDVGSTKARISAIAADVLPHPENYVPGHPMAGSEKSGIAGARPDLFKGAHWILCPDAAMPAEHFPRLHELVTSLGARVVALPREDHDAAVAVVSHVPHFVASSLVQLAHRHADEQQALMRLAAGGFKDTTRIAAGSPELWCGIAFDNKEALLAGLVEMQQIIGQFADALNHDDKAALTGLLADAAEVRRALPAAWVPSTERLLEVRIPMEDRPGVVAEVTTVASSVGCNIQSIEIDHVTEDSAVLSLILTDEGDVGKLSVHLINAGFSVSFNPLTAKEHAHV